MYCYCMKQYDIDTRRVSVVDGVAEVIGFFCLTIELACYLFIFTSQRRQERKPKLVH